MLMTLQHTVMRNNCVFATSSSAYVNSYDIVTDSCEE